MALPRRSPSIVRTYRRLGLSRSAAARACWSRTEIRPSPIATSLGWVRSPERACPRAGWLRRTARIRSRRRGCSLFKPPVAEWRRERAGDLGRATGQRLAAMLRAGDGVARPCWATGGPRAQRNRWAAGFEGSAGRGWASWASRNLWSSGREGSAGGGRTNGLDRPTRCRESFPVANRPRSLRGWNGSLCSGADSVSAGSTSAHLRGRPGFDVVPGDARRRPVRSDSDGLGNHRAMATG
jgi:hypothetical protein